VIGEAVLPGVILASKPSTGESCPAGTITIAAAGSFFKGAPEISVAVDGKDIGNFPLEENPPADAAAPLDIDRDLTAPTHRLNVPGSSKIERIEVRFTNDLWEGEGKDRNVNIHALMFNNTAFSNTDVTFSDPDIGWVNPHGVIQLFRTGSAVFKGPFVVDCP